jgi:hypothetical protein
MKLARGVSDSRYWHDGAGLTAVHGL